MLSKKKVSTLLLIVVFAFTILTGCGGQTSSTSDTPSEIKLGVIAPISGSVATYGNSNVDGIKLAVKEINAAGGINGAQVSLIVEDDQGKPDDAANAVQKLINQDQVDAIVGAVTSGCTLAAGQIAQSSGVPMIAGPSTADQVGEIGEYVNRVCFKDSDQGAAIANFVQGKLGFKKAAVLYDVASDYSKGLAETFKAKYESIGGTIIAYETYSTNDTDFNAQITKIKSQNPDVIILPDYYNVVGLIAQQIRQQGLQSVLVGGDGWESADLFKIGGDAVEGAYFSTHYSSSNPSAETKAFVDAYKAEYGKDPDAFAALGYDAAKVMMDAMARAGSLDKAAVKDAINSTKDYPGATGSITIDKGNVLKTLVFVQVKDGAAVYVDKVLPN